MRRTKERSIAWLVIALLAAWVAGCSAQFAAPRTFNERLGYAYASLASARATAASLLERDRITVEEAKRIQSQADQARALLDAAAAEKIPSTAEETLQLANRLLVQLEAYLRAREGGMK